MVVGGVSSFISLSVRRVSKLHRITTRVQQGQRGAQWKFGSEVVVVRQSRRRNGTSSSNSSGGGGKKQEPQHSPNGMDDSATTMVVPKAFGIGTLAGVCGSLVGMGGGFVMIPLMTSSLLRLSQHQAHGTSLFAVTTTGLAGALGYSGQVNFDAAAAIACGGMITARIGATVTSKLSASTLKRALGIFMLCVAPIVPAKSYLAEYSNEKEAALKKSNGTVGQTSTSSEANNESSILVTARRVMVPGTIGLGSGFLAGLFGVGGGAIVVPALTVFTDMTHIQSLGTSLCAMTLPAMVGTATHYSKGNVAMRVAPPLALGAFVGGYCGGRLGLQLDETALRWAFSALMVVLGVRTFRAA